MKRVWRGFFVLLMVGGTGCVSTLNTRRPTPPDMSLFETGDVVVTFCASPVSWLIASSGGDVGTLGNQPFSHAEVLTQSSSGKWMLAGISNSRVRVRPFKKALREFQHFALYRLDSEPKSRQVVKVKLAEWLRDKTIRGAQFDYLAQDVPGRRDRFFCIGFVNELYRDAKAPPPFLPPASPCDTAMGKHFAETFGISPDHIVLAGSIVRNDKFRRILLWKNDVLRADDILVNRETAQLINRFYTGGWRLKTNSRTAAFWAFSGGLCENLPGNARVALGARKSIIGFSRRIMEMWERLDNRGKIPNLTVEEKKQLLQKNRTKISQ